MNVSDVRDAHSAAGTDPRPGVLFNLAGQTSHVDSLHDPYTDLDINCRASSRSSRPAGTRART